MKQFVLKKSGNEFDEESKKYERMNDNRYIDDAGEPEEEKEEESNEDE